jgi:hypothetical protein
MIDSRFNLDFTDRSKTRESVTIDVNYEDLDDSGGVRLISINQSTEESSKEGEAGSSTMSGQQKLLLPDDTVANDLEEAGRWIVENAEYDGMRNIFDQMFSEPENKERMKKRAGIKGEQRESSSGKNYTAFADTESLKEILTEYMDEEEAESVIENGIKPTVSLSDEEPKEETKMNMKS